MADQKISHQDSEYKLYVYVIESEAGVVKIGFSGDPQARLLALLTGHPFALEVVYTRHHDRAPLLEKIIHRILQPLKMRGEWFKCSRSDAIAAVDAAFDILLIGEGFANRGARKAAARVVAKKRETTVIPFRKPEWGNGISDAFISEVMRMKDAHGSIRCTAAAMGVSAARVQRALEAEKAKRNPGAS